MGEETLDKLAAAQERKTLRQNLLTAEGKQKKAQDMHSASEQITQILRGNMTEATRNVAVAKDALLTHIREHE